MNHRIVPLLVSPVLGIALGVMLGLSLDSRPYYQGVKLEKPWPWRNSDRTIDVVHVIDTRTGKLVATYDSLSTPPREEPDEAVSGNSDASPWEDFPLPPTVTPE